MTVISELQLTSWYFGQNGWRGPTFFGERKRRQRKLQLRQKRSSNLGWLDRLHFADGLVRWTFAYWAAVYVLFSLRSLVNPHPHLLLQGGLRFVTIAVGVCLSFALARLLRTCAARGDRRLLVMFALAGAADAVYVLVNYAVFYVLPGLWTPPHGPVAKILSYLVELFWLYPGWLLGFLVLEHPSRKAGLLQRAPAASVWVYESGAHTRVPVSEIAWIESEGDYVRLHTTSKSHLVRGTLKGMQEELADAGFLRIHRRLLVRTDLIEKLRRGRSSRVSAVLATGVELPVGRSYERQVRQIA